MSILDLKATKRKIIPHNPSVADNYLDEHGIARILMIDLYGRDAVLFLQDKLLMSLGYNPYLRTDQSIKALTSVYQQIIALHTAVRVCGEWEKDLKTTPEFEKEKAYLIRVFSVLDEKDISIFELLTSSLPIFREASRLYNKIKD